MSHVSNAESVLVLRWSYCPIWILIRISNQSDNRTIQRKSKTKDWRALLLLFGPLAFGITQRHYFGDFLAMSPVWHITDKSHVSQVTKSHNVHWAHVLLVRKMWNCLEKEIIHNSRSLVHGLEEGHPRCHGWKLNNVDGSTSWSANEKHRGQRTLEVICSWCG